MDRNLMILVDNEKSNETLESEWPNILNLKESLGDLLRDFL